MNKFLIRFLSVLLALQSFAVGQLLTAAPARASETPDVIINEVMWMGSSLSSADEWIELRNLTSDPIDLAGWKLSNSAPLAGVLTISTGTIDGDGLFLIANYDKTAVNSVLDVTADLVTSSVSLSNTCAQIDLSLPDDTVVDSMGCNGGDYFYPAASATKHALERNVVYGDGLLSESWHERTEGSANIDAAAVDDLATPKFVNDTTTPDLTTAGVNDGTSDDIDWTADNSTADANWFGFADELSGIVSYRAGLGTSPGSDDVAAFADVGLNTSHSFGLGGNLTEGETYFATVIATNGVGLEALLSSDGLTLDTMAPEPVTNLTVTDVPGDNGGSLTLDWDPSVSTDEITYRVDYNQLGSSDVTSIAGIVDTSVAVSNLENSPAQYQFTVTAVDFSSLESVGNPTVTGSALDNLAPVLDPAKVVVGQNKPGSSDLISGKAGVASESATVMVFDRHPSEPAKTTIASVMTDTNRGFAALSLGDNLYGSVWIQLVDASGNASVPAQFGNDVVGPDKPVITKAQATCYSQRCQVEINWALDGTDADYFQIRYGAGVNVKTSLPVSGNSLILDLSADGTFQVFEVVAFDRFGNPSATGQAFKASLVPGVVTTATLVRGQLVTATTALPGSKETLVVKTDHPAAKLVPTARAADGEEPEPDNTQVAGSQDWLRIAMVVVLLLIVAGGFYSLSRSMQKSSLDVPPKPAKAKRNPPAAKSAKKGRRRGKRKRGK